MRFSLFYKCIFLCLIPLSGIADPYHWPTNATRLLSGTFGETRSAHFHSGIDIKTWARDGYECYAPADGYIERIVVSPGGYGKVVYIRLNDNRIAVLAHLDSFAGRVASRIRSEQESRKKVFLNLRFDPFEYRVQKGDVVAYSGHSGTVVPHIHFEIRDSSNYPINPLLNGFPIEDNVAPEPQEIAFIPLQPGSRVNGSREGKIFTLMKEKGNVYTPEDTVYLYGTFGVSLKAWDRGNYPHNKNGVYSLSLYLDGRNIFETRFDKLDWNQTHWMHEDRHYRLSREGNGEFYTLYSTEATQDLSFYRSQNGGHLTIFDGIHNLVIQTRDANGNRSGVRVVVKGQKPEKNPCRVEKEDDVVSVIVDSLFYEDNPKAGLVIERYNPYGNKEAEIRKTLNELPDRRLKIRLSEKDALVMLIRVIPEYGPEPPPLPAYFYDTETFPKPEIKVIPRHFAAGLLFDIVSNQVLPPSLLLSLEGRDCRPVEWEPVSAKKALTAPVSPDDFISYDGLKIYDYHQHEWVTVWNMSPVVIKTEEMKSFASSDEKFHVNIPERTFFRDVVSWISEEDPGNHPEGGEIVSRVYSLHPQDQPLQGSMMIQLQADETYPDHEKAGLYRQGSKGKWSLVQGDYDLEYESYRTEINRCGTFAMIRDEQVPVFEKTFPGNGGSYVLKDLKKAWVEISDNLSGIDAYHLEVTLNGRWMIYYYNAPTRIMSMEFPSRIPRGEHTLSWTIRDKAGHEQKKMIKFTIIDN
jgi:hypothetical protein